MRRTLMVLLTAALFACAPTWQTMEVDTVKQAMPLPPPPFSPGTPMVSWSPALNTAHVYSGLTMNEVRSGGADGVSRNLVTISGSGCELWGLVGGTWADPNPSLDWNDEHYRSGIKAEKPCGVVDRVVVREEGDAVKPKADDVRLSRSWVDQSRDDCYQADYGNDGLVIEDSLLYQCYSAISARPSSTIDASGSTLSVFDSIVTVSDKPTCYKPSSYGCPNHAGWLKWEKNSAIATRLFVTNTTFAASSYPEIGSLALNAPIRACVGVVLDFTGPTSEYSKFLADAQTWKNACPDTIVNTGAAASTHLQGVIADWHSRHDSRIG